MSQYQQGTQQQPGLLSGPPVKKRRTVRNVVIVLTMAYVVALPKAHVSSTLQLEVAPGWDYEGSHFEGKLSN